GLDEMMSRYIELRPQRNIVRRGGAGCAVVHVADEDRIFLRHGVIDAPEIVILMLNRGSGDDRLSGTTGLSADEKFIESRIRPQSHRVANRLLNGRVRAE